MKKQERADLVAQLLEEYFPEVKVSLDHTSNYELLVATLLSAQCTDARVNLTTPKLFAKANTPEKMTFLTVDAIEEIIRPCGISKNKAKAIYGLSEKLIKEFGGKVPGSLEALETLPGVGHKTASVVVSQGFNIPAFPVDTHIHRCAKRWGLSTGKNVVQTERDLKALFPESTWNKLHLQIIYFAREYCPARGHDDEGCPICSSIK